MSRHRLLTLALLGGCLAAAAAVGAQDRQADPKAAAMMREVYQKRYTWGDDFPGFQADLVVQVGGKEARGSARVRKDYGVSVDLPDAEAAKWAEDALASISAHRRGVRFETADGGYPLAFGPEDRHPTGRLIRLNDKMNSTYRVRDGQIMQVNRAAGPKMRFTIDIAESLQTEDGRYLPRVFTVAYFDSGSGAIKQSQLFRDAYRKTAEYYLPESRLEITALDGGTEIRSLRLDNVKLLR
jgi:hypothetical protein